MAQTLKHILCIDDEQDILEVARLALETVGGFEVDTCNGGKEALEKVASINPDLILLDVMMPDMDGPTTLGKLMENPQVRHIPVIFMTAKVQPQEMAHYLSLGASGVIPKPFDPMTLASQVQAVWNKTNSKTGAA